MTDGCKPSLSHFGQGEQHLGESLEVHFASFRSFLLSRSDLVIGKYRIDREANAFATSIAVDTGSASVGRGMKGLGSLDGFKASHLLCGEIELVRGHTLGTMCALVRVG